MRFSSSSTSANFGAASPADHALTRRWFLRYTALAGGAVAAGAIVSPARAFANTGPESPANLLPRPIPWGATGAAIGDPGNTHFFHVLPPFPPGADGQYTDCATITDFDGRLAAANVNGHGTGTPTATNPAGRYDFNVDMRVMHGKYIGVDGKHHVGIFGFI
jgi:hypothetical protein